MEQENPSIETSSQQDSHVQQPSQTLPQHHSSNTEAPDMMIENTDSEDVSNMNLSQLLKICQFKKALSLLESELDSKQANLGEFHIELVPLLNQMADIQISRAQYSKASELCQKIEQILQNYHEDPDYNSLMAHTLQNMAVISRENNNKTEALDLINKSLELSPPGSLQNIEIHRIKALVLCDFKHYKAAQQELKKSLKLVNKLTNTTDNILLGARVNNTVGELCLAYDDWHYAKIAYEESMDILKANDLGSHVEMAKACEGFGYSSIEANTASEKMIRGLASLAINIYGDSFGEDWHPARISSYLLFPRFCKSIKPPYPPNSNILADLAVKEAEEFYGSDCEKTREIRISAAKVSVYYEVKVDIVKPILETSIENKSGRELGNLYFQKCEAALLSEDFDFFEAFFPEAVNVIKDIYGEMSLEMAKLSEKIAIFYQLKGNLWKMAHYTFLRRDIYKENFGENHIEVAKACFILSENAIARDMFSEALYFLEQTLKIQVDFYGEIHPAVIETLTQMATCYLQSEEALKSLKTYHKILRLQKELGCIEICETCRKIGNLYSGFNDTRNAENYYQKSYQITKVNFGKDNARAQDIRRYSAWSAIKKDLFYENQAENLF